MVGAKLQVIITKLGLSIQDRGDVVKGAPVVQPGDDLFWFGRPRFLLFLIHVVLFTVILLRLCLFMDSFNLPTFIIIIIVLILVCLFLISSAECISTGLFYVEHRKQSY